MPRHLSTLISDQPTAFIKDIFPASDISGAGRHYTVFIKIVYGSAFRKPADVHGSVGIKIIPDIIALLILVMFPACMKASEIIPVIAFFIFLKPSALGSAVIIKIIKGSAYPLKSGKIGLYPGKGKRGLDG